MSLTINSNVSSLQTQRQLGNRTEALEKNFERLSSGKRVNRASDDPAGLAVALSILAEADTGVVAARNISDGVSALSIADGALQSSSDILTRLGELSTQAANGTLSAEQRSALNNEYQALKSELDRIASTTEFNDQALLSGSSTINLQAGTDGSENSQLGVNLPGVSASSLGLADNILTQENARLAIDQTKSAIASVASSRAEIGAAESRLSTAFTNLQTTQLNQRSAASRILDADYAEESAKLVSNRIGQQAGAAVGAQANILPQLALKLLG